MCQAVRGGLVQLVLEKVQGLPGALRTGPSQDLITEICLSLPSRPVILCPFYSQLLPYAVQAVHSDNAALVSLGLATVQGWADTVRSEAFWV